MANRRAVVTIHEVERLPNSVNGNAQFRLFTDNGNYSLEKDSSYAQNIKNFADKLPVRRLLILSGHNIIIGIEEA